MKSYAYVECIEDGIAVLELRLTAIDEEPAKDAKQGRRYRQPRKMVEVPVENLTRVLQNVKERDVIVVEHTDGLVQNFCYIDYEEMQRRLERARARQEKLKAKMQQNLATEN